MIAKHNVYDYIFHHFCESLRMSVNGVLGITVVKRARCKTEIIQVQSKVCSKFYSRKPFTDLYLSVKDSYLWEIWRKVQY